MSEPKCNLAADLTSRRVTDAVCINTSKVYDSCADKDCLADLRVYLTDCAQDAVDSATSIRCRGCEVLNVFTEVEKIPFNRGFYAVDLTFFFKVTLDVYTTPNANPKTVCGLAVFSKKCILFGSEGSVKVFSSEYAQSAVDEQLLPVTTNPRVVVQVADPICLDAKICRPCDCHCSLGDDLGGVPNCIRSVFEGQFARPSLEKAVRVTIGVFSIVQLERDVQILIPAYDFCMPTKDCCAESEDPCDAFRRIQFPVDEFFPPSEQLKDNCEDLKQGCKCNK